MSLTVDGRLYADSYGGYTYTRMCRLPLFCLIPPFLANSWHKMKTHRIDDNVAWKHLKKKKKKTWQ